MLKNKILLEKFILKNKVYYYYFLHFLKIYILRCHEIKSINENKYKKIYICT